MSNITLAKSGAVELSADATVQTLMDQAKGLLSKEDWRYIRAASDELALACAAEQELGNKIVRLKRRMAKTTDAIALADAKRRRKTAERMRNDITLKVRGVLEARLGQGGDES